MKISPSVKVAALSLGVIAAAFGGFRLYAYSQLQGFQLDVVEPGRVNLIAVQPTAGYRIVVSNGIAHLHAVDPDNPGLEAPDTNEQPERDSPRLPIRETLRGLQGDEDALGRLVMSVNKIKEDDLPPVRTVWTAEDLGRALDGDAGLRERLARSLHTTLDGRPTGELDFGALTNGIVVDSPVAVRVKVGGAERTLTARIQEPFKTLFAQSVENRVMEKFNPRREVIVGTYREEALKLTAPGANRQDVARAIRDRIDPERLAKLATPVERILRSVTVVVTDTQVRSASFEAYEGPNRQRLADLVLNLTEEGRMRLWKYSHEAMADRTRVTFLPGQRPRAAFQLLLTMDGVAIAAPRIRTELSEPDVRLLRIPSESLVEDAVKLIGEIASGKKNR